MSNRAVLLVNLGSPDSTSVADVRRYLREFLSDDRVLDAPKAIQQFILNCFILPTRPRKSAAAYSTIWTDEGSPLIVTSKKLQSALQEKIEPLVDLAMRYGNPSIPDSIERLKGKGVTELFLVPLYPHYAMSSYETVVVKVMQEARVRHPELKIATLQPFYKDPAYIEALYMSAKPYLKDEYDHLLFSYHGIPVRHLGKADSSKAHCNIVPDCCHTCSPAHSTCYRHQCFSTTEHFVKRAGIPAEKHSVSFQSRLGRDPWLEPYTDHTLESLARAGKTRIAVMTPAFVSDCLETLEEIAEEGKEEFMKAGGEKFTMIPCLNEHPAWIQFLADKTLAWLGAT